MRALLLILSIAMIVPAFAQECWEKHTLDRIAHSEARGHFMLKDRDAFPDRSFDITYQHLDLQADPAIRAINGTVTHHLTALDDLDQLVFDLSDSLNVITVFDQNGTLSFTHAGDQLIIPINLLDGAFATISIEYGGIPPESGFGSFVQSDHEGTPVIWTLSEPYGAMDWWPCKQDLQDKADSIDIRITTPSTYRAASNGLLIEEVDLAGGLKRFHWRHRYPIAHYLIAFAVTNYEVYHTQIEMANDTVPMETWAYPENAFEMQLNAGDIQQQMPLFSDLFGLYPFANEKYGHCQFGWGGGMEHQTISFMGGFSYELAAHELAHQWFGNKVTCGSWEDIWLNEGFASYLSGLTYDFLAPQYWHPWKAAQIDHIVSEPDGSVRCTDTTTVDRIFDARLSYRKGAFVLHMLRWIMGDEDFFQACRNYLDDPQLAYSSARTADLQMHMETATGMDLDGFFADWYFGEGHPMYHVEWAQDASGEVNLSLAQTPSHPSVEFFELPVPIGFSNGEQDTVIVFDHTFSGEEFSFTLPFQAHEAVLDPDLWLISGQNVVTNIAELDVDRNSMLLFPNPADDRLNIRLADEWNGSVDLRVIDAIGKIVIEDRSALIEGLITLPIDRLPAGIYSIEVMADDRKARSSFIRR